MSKYFDVHSFLAEQETVPVVFNSGCTGLGKEMDKQCDGHDLPSYAEVMLPFWLVPKLFEQNMVAPSLPECFDERVWMVVHAEPRNVPIREFCPHFFRFGKALNLLLRDDELAANLSQAFGRRYKALLCQAHGTGDSNRNTCWRARRNACSTWGGTPCWRSTSGGTARRRRSRWRRR